VITTSEDRLLDAPGVVFLASDDARRITGEIMVASGTFGCSTFTLLESAVHAAPSSAGLPRGDLSRKAGEVDGSPPFPLRLNLL